MIITLSSQEMLQTWRKRAGLEPSSSSCSIVRFDGIDIDSVITGEMRRWYLGLLDQGDPALVGPPADASGLLTLDYREGDRHATVVADGSVRRLHSLRLSGWMRESVVAEVDAIAGRLKMQANRFAGNGRYEPLAWRDSGGIVRVIPADGTSTVISAKAYIDRGEDVYVIDERAISTIPNSLQLL